MKKLKTIRDNNDTKNEAGVVLVAAEIPNTQDGYFQLYYDLDFTKPVPLEEAEIYYSSGRLCSLTEGSENRIEKIVNIGGLFVFVYDDECPNGYYLTPNEMIFGGSSGTESLTCIGELSYTIAQNGELIYNGSSEGNLDYDPYDLISTGSVFTYPEYSAGYYVAVKVHSDNYGVGQGVDYVAILMFSSAIKIMESNGKSYGTMSFSGLLDNISEEASPITVRYTFGKDGSDDEKKVDLILSN